MSDTPEPTTNPEQDQKLQYIGLEIERAFAGRFKGQRWWSFASHGSTVLIVAFSSTAAVLAKFSPGLFPTVVDNTTLATLLSLAVTIISTLQTKLGFERKWIANRMTRSALSQLRVDMNMGKSSCELADSLKKIYSQHDEAITASG